MEKYVKQQRTGYLIQRNLGGKGTGLARLQQYTITSRNAQQQKQQAWPTYTHRKTNQPTHGLTAAVCNNTTLLNASLQHSFKKTVVVVVVMTRCAQLTVLPCFHIKN